MRLHTYGWLIAPLLLSACGPSKQQTSQWTEEQRVACLDKSCEGDIAPKHDPMKEVALKLNGEWFIGPKEYFSTGTNGAAFYWPSKTPSAPGDRDFPERGLVTTGQGDQVTVQVFLRSNNSPPQGPSRYDHLKRAEEEGRLIDKEVLRPGLQLWRTHETDGLGPGLWYVATDHVAKDPNGSVLSCRDRDPKFDRCTTAFMWRPGIAADMRFRAKHSADWPEIYEEAIRVLQQLRKA